VFVAELPPRYNLHLIATEGCEDGAFLKSMLANPLGPPYEAALDLALYRWAHARALKERRRGPRVAF